MQKNTFPAKLFPQKMQKDGFHRPLRGFRNMAHFPQKMYRFGNYRLTAISGCSDTAANSGRIPAASSWAAIQRPPAAARPADGGFLPTPAARPRPDCSCPAGLPLRFPPALPPQRCNIGLPPVSKDSAYEKASFCQTCRAAKPLRSPMASGFCRFCVPTGLLYQILLSAFVGIVPQFSPFLPRFCRNSVHFRIYVRSVQMSNEKNCKK